MSIVCGTDFSEMAAHAATAAACLAARTGRAVHLIHALDLWPDELRDRPGHPVLLWAESRLRHEAERLRALGVEVHVHALAGHAEVVLETAARDFSASSIVVGAIGHHGRRSHELGSRADRTAQRSHVPVLTVRDSAPFVAWLKEGRALRVVLGIDDSQSVENAARWLDELCRAGAVELTLAHLYWPPEAFRRFGVAPSDVLRPVPDPAIAEASEAAETRLSRLIPPNPSDKGLRTQVHAVEAGEAWEAICQLGERLGVDLICLGTHGRSGWVKAALGSVAGRVLTHSQRPLLLARGPHA